MELLGLSYIASGDIKWCSLSRKQFFSFLKHKRSVYHMIQQLHSLVFTPRNKTLRSCKTCTQMFTARPFTVPKKHAPSTCPSASGWVNMAYSYSGVLFGSKKEWSSEACFVKEASCKRPRWMVPFTRNVQDGQVRREREGSGPLGLEELEVRDAPLGSLGDETVLKWITAAVVCLCECTNSHWSVCVKWVDYMVCELHLSKAAF